MKTRDRVVSALVVGGIIGGIWFFGSKLRSCGEGGGTKGDASPTASASGSGSASAIASASASTSTIVRKLDVRVHANATLQYDDAAVARGLSGAKFGIKSCVEQNRPAKIPHALSILLELWDFAGEHGKVRDVRTHEPAPLAKCLRDALMGLEFGPGKDPKLPPGPVFVVVDVDYAR